MKNKLRNFAAALILSTAALTAPGCKTQSTISVTYKSLGATITTVDAGMKAWADSYVRRRKAAGSDETKLTALDNEFALVSVAKDRYNTVMALAFGTIEAAYKVNPASVTPPDVSAAAQNLLIILQK